MSTDKWKKENCVSFLLRFTLSSGIPEALKKVEESSTETGKAYIRRVVTESLIRDGYLPKPEPRKK